MTAEVERAQDYLRQFGYIEGPAIERFHIRPLFAPEPAPPVGELDERTRNALRSFQEWMGLPVTGELDDATLELMERPRCGFPDVGEFVIQGNKWNTSNLRYSVYDFSNLQQADVFRTLEAAFKMWSDVANLNFTRVTGLAEIRMGFVPRSHGDFDFDGPFGVLAHAFYPPPNGGDFAGDCHFDEDENWDWTPNNSQNGIDIITVAAHELGHALGLAHSRTIGALMYPTYGGPQRTLSADDIGGIQQIYGARTAPPDEPETPEPTNPVRAYERFAAPREMVMVRRANIWDFNKEGFDFTPVATWNEGTGFTIVGQALHSNGSSYLMDSVSFGQADVTGQPYKTHGINAVDLRERGVTPPIPDPEPEPEPEPEPKPTPWQPTKDEAITALIRAGAVIIDGNKNLDGLSPVDKNALAWIVETTGYRQSLWREVMGKARHILRRSAVKVRRRGDE